MNLDFTHGMEITEILGFIGALIAVSAYLPQLVHLIRERCTAGLSRAAFSLWFVSSALITVHAWHIRAIVFISMGFAQLIAISIILYYVSRYNGMYCGYHMPLGKE